MRSRTGPDKPICIGLKGRIGQRPATFAHRCQQVSIDDQAIPQLGVLATEYQRTAHDLLTINLGWPLARNR